MNELWAGRSMAVSVYSGTAAASIHVNLCHCRGTISLRICLGPYGESTVASRATCGGDATPTTTEAMAYFLFSPSLPFRPRRWAQYMNQQLSPPSLPSFLPHDALYKAFPAGIQNLRGCCRLLLSYSNFCQFGNQTI